MMAKAYGNALFSLAEELSLTDVILNEARTVRLILNENPEYIKIQDSPAVSAEEKKELIGKAFGSLSESVKNLLMILAEARKFYLFGNIDKEFEKLYNESRRICEAEVITATPLDEERLKKIKDKLEYTTGMTVVIKPIIDKSLIGGIKLRYLGKEIDGSIKARFAAMEKNLKDVII